MEQLNLILQQFWNQIPFIGLLLIMYFLIRLTLRYCEMSHETELENIRNSHQKDMFDKSTNREKEILRMKNEHEIKIKNLSNPK